MHTNPAVKSIARLGSDSCRERESAMRELRAMGASTADVLRAHLKAADPEVHQAIESLLAPE